MKTRVKKKQDKALLNFSLVCERIAATVVEKVSNVLMLQKCLDEYERFLGDLMLMLITDNPDHKALAADLINKRDDANEIWRRVKKLMQDNRKLALELQKKEALDLHKSE